MICCIVNAQFKVPSQKQKLPKPETIGFRQIRSNLVEFGWICSDSIGFGRTRRTRSDLVRFGRIWLDLVGFGCIWLNLVGFGRGSFWEGT